MYGIASSCGANKEIILNPSDLKPFKLEYRNKLLYMLSKEKVDELNNQIKTIINYGIIPKSI